MDRTLRALIDTLYRVRPKRTIKPFQKLGQSAFLPLFANSVQTPKIRWKVSSSLSHSLPTCSRSESASVSSLSGALNLAATPSIFHRLPTFSFGSISLFFFLSTFCSPYREPPLSSFCPLSLTWIPFSSNTIVVDNKQKRSTSSERASSTFRLVGSSSLTPHNFIFPT